MRFIGILTFVAAALNCTVALAQRSPTSVASSAYRELTCPQIAQEGRAISKRGFVASGFKAGRGGSDATERAPAIVIVWPELSITGDELQSDKITLANTEMDALEQASVASQCSIRFQRSPPKG
jgi:hypothetical protein